MPEAPDQDEANEGGIAMTPPPPESDFFARKCTRLEAQISSLKEVSSLRRDLLDIRSREVKNLIEKLKLFEEAIGAERQYRASLSTRVQAAEEKCVELTGTLTTNNENLQRIKENYQEKINQLAQDLEKSDADHVRTTDELNDSEMRNIDLNARVTEYAKLIEVHEKNVKDLKAELKVVSERNQAFAYQINLLNTLFNEIEGTPIDFDRIRAIGDIVRETHSMPTISEPPQPSTSSEEDQDELQRQASPRRASIDFDSIIDQIETDKHTGEIPGEESCYKKVSTVHGPQLVLSVSQTFIKLKDLILEKKSLQREIDSLKNLNTKLEHKVDRQERRLFQVGSELNKTWNLVAKLKCQHSKLHTSKAVLKYELHEKRKLLEKLKDELSYSRQQYAQVRQKHNESEILCQSMRADFARRRQASSLESGAFSDVSDSPVSFSNSSEEPMSCEDPEIQLAMQNSTTDDDDEEDDEEEETQEVLDEEDNEDYEMEIDPIQELVSDLVDEIQAVTAEEEATIEQPEGDDATRASRLRMLEEASRILYSRLVATTAQSSALSSRLAQLHNHYGSHDLPISEPFEIDETTANTESSTTDVAYASNNNTSQNAADDTEVDSQYEDASLPITHRNSQALNGSVEMIHEDMLLTEAVDTVAMSSDVAAAVPSTSTAVGANLMKAVAGARPMTVETQTDLALAGPSSSASAHRCEDCEAQLEDAEGSSESSSPDPNCLSRLIIQQVPKRLEMLKLQNLNMREKEQALNVELKKQRSLLETIQAEKAQLAAEFENRMRSRENEIKSLHDKITELVSSTSRDKENITTFAKAYMEEKSQAAGPSGTQVEQQDSSKCGTCSKKFSIFGRRKHKCNVCLQKFCQDCCKAVQVQGSREARRMCSACQRRNILLDTAAKIFTEDQKN